MKAAKLERPKSPITGEELARMPRLGRCELVRGEIVHASPTSDAHGGIEGNFYHELRSFVLPLKLGKVRVGEVGIYTRTGPDTVRAADAVFISNERYSRRSRRRGFLDVAPDLVVEVLSSGDRPADVEAKLREYFEIGVRLVWVADPELKMVHAYRSVEDARAFGEGDALPGEDVLPGFSVPVSRLFED